MPALPIAEEVAALPRSRDLRRPKIEDLDFLRVHTRFVQREQKLIVRGRDERCRNLLALQSSERRDPRLVGGDKLLGIVDVVEDPDELDVDALRGRRRDRARLGSRAR